MTDPKWHDMTPAQLEAAKAELKAERTAIGQARKLSNMFGDLFATVAALSESASIEQATNEAKDQLRRARDELRGITAEKEMAATQAANEKAAATAEIETLRTETDRARVRLQEVNTELKDVEGTLQHLKTDTIEKAMAEFNGRRENVIRSLKDLKL